MPSLIRDSRVGRVPRSGTRHGNAPASIRTKLRSGSNERAGKRSAGTTTRRIPLRGIRPTFCRAPLRDAVSDPRQPRRSGPAQRYPTWECACINQNEAPIREQRACRQTVSRNDYAADTAARDPPYVLRGIRPTFCRASLRDAVSDPRQPRRSGPAQPRRSGPAQRYPTWECACINQNEAPIREQRACRQTLCRNDYAADTAARDPPYVLRGIRPAF